MEKGTEKKAWRREQRRGRGEGSREEGMENGTEKKAWRREQRRGQGINKGPQDSHAFLPPYSLSQDFLGLVFSMKQTAFHALLARQHPWGNPSQQLIITHYCVFLCTVLYCNWISNLPNNKTIRVIRTQLESWLLAVSVCVVWRLPQRT